MVSKMKVISLIIIGVGIILALFGTYYYQYAISGVIYATGTGQAFALVEQSTLNMILTSIMAITGVIATILGVGLIIYSKND